MSTDRPRAPQRDQAPVRSGDPQRDWHLEGAADTHAGGNSPSWDPRQLRRMSWRAEGAQDYPGGALETLLEISQRGLGPKHQPSDARLREIICERLTEDPAVDASDVEVAVHDAEATLSGTVLSRVQKRAAEDLVAEIAGVAQVNNRLVIRPSKDEIDDRMSGL